ncbi:putative transcription factor interactor and regulator CCHC(Zn) family [Medicago truncatula]|uniref:Putative transcription factor interactor and regulator CCHC(Zn) family n=1 Tax=Medicago truncatula TaxID=3880 RepID=A0A396GU28_MEDTR|nr:uncharacterized protein LOC112417247 [Medicago truncatula]RHN42107.1 putative transcription factor interactor and regulator CCHC(Zn) family [Medicago truncatula]
MKWVENGNSKVSMCSEKTSSTKTAVATKKKGTEKTSSTTEGNVLYQRNVLNGGDNNVSKSYENHYLKIRFHYKGYFISDPMISYKKGEIHEYGGEWDIDEVNLQDLDNLIREIGVLGEYKLWYICPGFDIVDGLRLLNTDRDVVRFINEHRNVSVAEFYVESKDVEVEDCRYDSEVEEVVVVDKGKQPAESDERDESDPDYNGEEEGEIPDYEVEDEDGSVGDVSVDDSDFDEEWDWTTILPTQTVNPTLASQADNPNQAVVGVEVSRNPQVTGLEDFEDENEDSDFLESPDASEEEEGSRKRKLNRFKLGTNNDPVVFEEGQIFATGLLIKTAVKEYGLQSKTNVYLEKNEKKRIVVKCMPGCPYHIRFSRVPPQTHYVLSSLKSVHNCYPTGKIRVLSGQLLAKKLVPLLKHTPTMTLKGLKDECKNRWNVMLSSFQIYMAKLSALEMIHGASDEQYAHLRNYAEELLRSNPGSSVKIQCKPGVGGVFFQRMYVCFNACKRAFVSNCRPLIGLDGCFLKGRYGGHLLSAVGKDGNNQMIPIAFVVVEAETKDSWDWFMDLLLSDLNGVEFKRWSFISDQQKGLVNTIAAIGEHIEHRLCVRHLYGNWRKRHAGEKLKEALWKAARACTMPEFNKAMEDLKGLSVPAWEEMRQYAPGMWSRAGYSTHTNCDLQVNNMCEAFNSAILDLRDLPIISLVEGLKFYITNRIVKLRDYMLRYQGEICPMIRKIVEKAKKDTIGWTPIWCGDRESSMFSMTDGTNTYVVNLKDKTCACRKWDLSGIPCPHAIAEIYYNQANVDDYVAHWKQKFLDTYDNLILPSNGPKLWPEVNTQPILPLGARRAPGRPKKARRKENDEPKSANKKGKRNQETVRCRSCKELGHNTRTCGGKTGADRRIPPGGNKDITTQSAQTGIDAQAAQPNNNAPAQAGTSNVQSTVTKRHAAAKGKKPLKKKSKTAAGTPADAANGTTSVNNIATGTHAGTVNGTTVAPAATNTSGTMRGGNHVVGEVALFVPRKSRTTGVKRSINEVGNVGTQQSVNKT